MKQLISIRKIITALILGNALEWYDFVIYALMTVYIAANFFPATNEINSLLAATATFGVAFFFRPLGGVVLGMYADKKGRTKAITLVISLMTVALLLIAAAPTYQQAGIIAPLIILIARLLQGFSAGGEFGAATAMLIELAPLKQRGFFCAWQMAGQTVAMLLGSVVGILLTKFLSAAQLHNWGWRLPFIFGLIIAPIGIYLRKKLPDPVIPACARMTEVSFRQQIRLHTKKIFMAGGLAAGGTAACYINLLYMPTYVHQYLHFNMHDAFTGVTLGSVIIFAVILFSGWLSDHIGRKPILLTAITAYLICIYPLFQWLNEFPTYKNFIIVQASVCTLLGIYYGVYAVVLAELFPTAIRSTSMSISYNVTVMLFGGFAQFIVTGLIYRTGTPLAVTYYLIFALAVSFIAALFYQEHEEDYEYAGMAVAANRI